MKHLPIGIQTFSKIIEGDFLYIDKTEIIYNLISDAAGAYFLSRPRRFGKSLLISTLEEIFLGNRELFKGLWIYDSDWRWHKYPVIRLDFSKQMAGTAEKLEVFLKEQMDYIASAHGFSLTKSETYSRFEELITVMGKNEKVVILIDEYDKPIIDHLETENKAAEMREVLRGFFSVLKGCDQHILFLFLTGVSKFSQAGVFSHLNHLNDITLSNDYSSMLGITHDELKKYFREHILRFAKEENKTEEELTEKIRYWYNGYKFSQKGIPVYNPFSTLLLFDRREFSNYWFSTGTPAMLVKLMLKKEYDLSELPLQLDELNFRSYEIDKLELTPLLLQTGYLTIKDFDSETALYSLDFPNYEVKKSFLLYFSNRIQKNEMRDSAIHSIINSLRDENLEDCFEYIREIFRGIDYDLQISQEKYYQTVFYLIFSLIGMKIKTEVKTNIGRIDAVIDDNHTYIFEFKLNGTKAQALQQIKDRKYHEKYTNKGKSVYLIGVEFQNRNIGEYVYEIIPR